MLGCLHRAMHMHNADYVVARRPSVCLSVRLSVSLSLRQTPVCIETAKQHFHRQVATPFCFFSFLTLWQYSDGDSPNGGVKCRYEQELSYRKQIARQLRTQYAEAIYDNPVTLKSRLTVIQGHWKRNHWVDRTRLTIGQFIGRWILSWPWKVRQRLLKVIEISAIRKLGCGFLFAFYSNYGRICSRLWDIQCQRMAWPWKPN